MAVRCKICGRKTDTPESHYTRLHGANYIPPRRFTDFLLNVLPGAIVYAMIVTAVYLVLVS